MSILIYAESENQKVKKSAFELASYAKALADQLQTTVTAVVINVDDAAELASYGVSKVLSVKVEDLAFSAKKYANIITKAAEAEAAKITLLSSSTDSKYLAPFLAIYLDAAVASNITKLPESLSPFVVERSSFSSKAFECIELKKDHKVLSLSSNSYGAHVAEVAISQTDFTVDPITEELKVIQTQKSNDKIAIADADIVVSGGRGLKGPENWHLIEDLATVLDAATACSKPVSDLGWRPHDEHVGQTGKPVASNLYIAIGISGAIQHLAGINASKVKVVINTDPEAPFFKAADYGIVGDAFEVVPVLIDKLKAFKQNN